MTPKGNDYEYTKEDLDNRSDQLNDNNDAYWQSRGEAGRPNDWEDWDEDDWEDQADDLGDLGDDCGNPGDDCGDDQSWD